MFEITETDKDIVIKLKETTEHDITNEIQLGNGITLVATMKVTDKNGNKLTQKEYNEIQEQNKERLKQMLSNKVSHFPIQTLETSHIELQSIRYSKEHEWDRKTIEKNEEILRRSLVVCNTIMALNQIKNEKKEKK